MYTKVYIFRILGNYNLENNYSFSFQCHLSRQKRAKLSSVLEGTTFTRKPFPLTGSDGLAPAIGARVAKHEYSHTVMR